MFTNSTSILLYFTTFVVYKCTYFLHYGILTFIPVCKFQCMLIQADDMYGQRRLCLNRNRPSEYKRWLKDVNLPVHESTLRSRAAKRIRSHFSDDTNPTDSSDTNGSQTLYDMELSESDQVIYSLLCVLVR